jgi:DNA-binding GntR family transcriptional regulator
MILLPVGLAKSMVYCAFVGRNSHKSHGVVANETANFARHTLSINRQLLTIDNLSGDGRPMEMPKDFREAWEKRRQRSLTAQVREELERMILHGDVEAGARINENALAERLGVSRGPIREAARALERDGLVTSIANRGTFVRKLSVEDASELYELRALLAGRLCALVAERADADVRAELRSFVSRMDAAIRAEDETAYFALNLEFHDKISEAAGATRSCDLYTSLGKEVQLMRLRVLRGRSSLAISNQEHDRIVSAIEAGDADSARREGAEHHLNGKRRWLEKL